MNLEKPTKWVLNMASAKKTMDSPSNLLEKIKKKYTDRDKPLEDVNEFYADIFKKRGINSQVSQLKNY